MKLELKDGSLSVNGRRLFEGLSFVVRSGEVVCVAGGKGSGKTLLLRALMGMWPIDAGVASVDGAALTPLSAPYLRRLMGYVPQDRPTELFDNVATLVSDVLERECPIVFLDEVLTDQDERERQRIMQMVRHMVDKGVAVVLTCSDVDRLVSHVQGLSNGQMEFKFVELWKYQSSAFV